MMRLPSARVLAEQERRVSGCRRDVGDHLRRARETALDKASRPCSMVAAFVLGGVLGWSRPAALRGSAGQVRRPAFRIVLANAFQLGLRVLPYLLWRVRVRHSHDADLPPVD
ncbi:MAG: hypothetical protein H2060_09375 [Azoarcus sp.]|nr:hypothetical protein [Azoarcus sp.]